VEKKKKEAANKRFSSWLRNGKKRLRKRLGWKWSMPRRSRLNKRSMDPSVVVSLVHPKQRRRRSQNGVAVVRRKW